MGNHRALAFAVGLVVGEVNEAAGLYPPFHSTQEGHAGVRKAMDELDAEVGRKPRNVRTIRKKAAQVAAMAIKFIADCCLGGAGQRESL